ncbi:IS4 family transposase, partial [Shigella sonnei]
KGKGLPESGKGEALEIPHSPEKEPVSCLTDWHYSQVWRFMTLPIRMPANGTPTN